MIPWWGYSLAANVAVISIEYLYRIQPTLPDAMLRCWPLIIIAQVSLYFSYHGAPSLLGAWIMFTIANSAMRLGVSAFVLGEPVRLPWALIGISLAICAGLAIKEATK